MRQFIDHNLSVLAQYFGVATSYYSIDGTKVKTQPDILLKVLQALGAPLQKLEECSAALQEVLHQQSQQVVEPVVILPEVGESFLSLRLPSALADQSIQLHLTKESGEKQRWRINLGDLSNHKSENLGDLSNNLTHKTTKSYTIKHVPLPSQLPLGYHQLHFEFAGNHYKSTLIKAPLQAYQETPPKRRWGVFAPLYALRSKHDWGAGDFNSLTDLMHWLNKQGGSVVSTLPILSLFFQKEMDPSPYRPLSRLFWNEFYLNLESVPEFQQSPMLQKLCSSDVLQQEIQKLREQALVHYSDLMKLKRKLLNEMLSFLLNAKNQRYEEFQNFIKTKPLLQEYAHFRATTELEINKDFSSLKSDKPPVSNNNEFNNNEFEKHVLYHQYAQWLVEEQLQSVARQAQDQDILLSLDYPLGVHPDGFDVWRYPKIFATKISAGAPPDYFFQQGQDWGFAPWHPQGLRKNGYTYFRDSLRHHFRFSKLLRMDHIMALHRLFWIPHGCEAKDGVYVHYKPEEFYAVLCLESKRHQVLVLGEDLGTVPPEVRPVMAKHGLLRSFVFQVEPKAQQKDTRFQIPKNSVASLNTHDMPTFAAFWGKHHNPLQALQQSLLYLANSPALIVLVNLEDLWLESEPQNIPGTSSDQANWQPNWQRKFCYTLEEFSQESAIKELLLKVNQVRHNPDTN